MFAAHNISAVHAGNYYTSGMKRVLAKLAEMGIAVPTQALIVPKQDSEDTRTLLPPLHFGDFTPFKQALLDWFEGRDYDQAQALIHYRPPIGGWHIVRVLNEEKCPPRLSDHLLSTSKADAVASVIDGCDQDASWVDACRQEGDSIVFTLDGVDVARIDPVKIEPFDCSVRDRVQTAFKGVRRYDWDRIFARAARLPGLDLSAYAQDMDLPHPSRDGAMFFGFPANWALAMRQALKQVDIDVKQHQAQELAAMFLGAASWHQLVKHQNEPNEGMVPIAVVHQTPDGLQERYYYTSEEAMFATGTLLKTYPEPVVIRSFDLSFDMRRWEFRALTKRVFDASTTKDRFWCPSCIETGMNDYWRAEESEPSAYLDTARTILKKLDQDANVNLAGIVYESKDSKGILEGVLSRQGIPSDNLIYFEQHAIAVNLQPAPVEPLSTAYACIYQIRDGRAKEIANLAMYKAEVTIIDNGPHGGQLVIQADYGSQPPIEIPFSDMAQVKKLTQLLYADHLYTLVAPLFVENESKLRQ